MKTLINKQKTDLSHEGLLWFSIISLGLVFLAGAIAIGFEIRQNTAPFFVVYALGLSSPFLGAVAFHKIINGSLRPLKDMFIPLQFWPGGIMIVAVPLFSFIALCIASFFGLSVHWSSLPSPLNFLLFFAGWTTVIWLEETAWRGTLLPVLQEKYNPFVSSILVNTIWVLWHIPLLYLIDMTLAEMGWFALQTLGMSFSMTWAYNRSGTVLVAVFIHAAYNAATGWLLNAVHFVDPNDIIGIQAAGQIGLGIVVLILTKGYLGLQKESRKSHSRS